MSAMLGRSASFIKRKSKLLAETGLRSLSTLMGKPPVHKRVGQQNDPFHNKQVLQTHPFYAASPPKFMYDPFKNVRLNTTQSKINEGDELPNVVRQGNNKKIKNDRGSYRLLLLSITAISLMILQRKALTEPDKESHDMLEQALRSLSDPEIDTSDPETIKNILEQAQLVFNKLATKYPKLQGFSFTNFVNNDDVLSVQAKELERLCNDTPDLQALFNLCRAGVHDALAQEHLKKLQEMSQLDQIPNSDTVKDGIYKLALKKLDIARHYYKSALKAQSTDLQIRAHYQLAIAHKRTSLIHKKRNAGLRSVIELRRSLHEINEALKLGENANVRILAGDVHLLMEENTTAIEHYKKALLCTNTNRQRLQAHSKLSRLYYETNDYALVIENAEKALTLDAREKEAYQFQRILGFSHFAIKSYHEAIEHLEHTILVGPNDEEAVSKLAYAYDQTGQTEKAVSQYNAVLGINPDAKYVYYCRGRLYSKLGNYDAALSEFNNFYNLSSSKGEKYNTLVNLAMVYSLKGDFDRALDHYDQAITLSPDEERAYIGQALLLTQMTQTDESQTKLSELMDKAKDVNPELANKLATTVELEKQGVATPVILNGELEYRNAYRQALKTKQTASLEKVLRNRRKMTETELDAFLTACENDFVTDFDNRGENPTRIDKALDDLLFLEPLSEHPSQQMNMTQLRKKYHYKYEQHLHNKSDEQLPRGSVTKEETYNKLVDPEDPNKGTKEVSVLHIDTGLRKLNKGAGFNPENLLPLRIRSLVSIAVRLNKGIFSVEDLLPRDDESLKDPEKRAAKISEIKTALRAGIKREILCDVETLRCCMNERMIGNLQGLNLNTRNLLTAHFDNMKEKINSLEEGEEFTYPTGHREHSICVVFLKHKGELTIRGDNLGDGITISSPEGEFEAFRHPTVDNNGRFQYFSCLMNNLGNLTLDGYLRNIFRAKYTKAYLPKDANDKEKPDPDFKWSWIYYRQCEHPRKFPNWRPEEPQGEGIGNCVFRSHNVGARIRMNNDRYFDWMFEKEKTMSRKLGGDENPEYYGSDPRAMVSSRDERSKPV